jgi:hypothetical protein
MVTSYFAAAASLVVLAVISPELLKLLTTVRPHPIHFAPLRPLDPEAQVLESVERLFEDDPSFKVIIDIVELSVKIAVDRANTINV